MGAHARLRGGIYSKEIHIRKEAAMETNSISRDRGVSPFIVIGVSCLLIGFITALVGFILWLFATRMPFWLAGLPFISFGVGAICLGLGMLTDDNSVILILFGLVLLVPGLFIGSGKGPFLPLLNGLKEKDAIVNDVVQPERITSSTQANLSLTIQNRSTGMLELSDIKLQTPREFWNCFVIDYSAAKPSILAAQSGLSRIEYEDVTLTSNETLSIEVPLIGNQPGDCSGGFVILADATIGGRSYAKIDGRTWLNLSLMP
jgi:hypothetical protein